VEHVRNEGLNEVRGAVAQVLKLALDHTAAALVVGVSCDVLDDVCFFLVQTKLLSIGELLVQNRGGVDLAVGWLEAIRWDKFDGALGEGATEGLRAQVQAGTAVRAGVVFEERVFHDGDLLRSDVGGHED